MPHTDQRQRCGFAYELIAPSQTHPLFHASRDALVVRGGPHLACRAAGPNTNTGATTPISLRALSWVNRADRQPRGVAHAAQSTGHPKAQTLFRQTSRPRWVPDDFDTDLEVITDRRRSVLYASRSILPPVCCLLLPAVLKHAGSLALFESECREPAPTRVALQSRPLSCANAPTATSWRWRLSNPCANSPQRFSPF